MNKKTEVFRFNKEQRNQLIQEFGSILREKVILQQTLREQQQQALADSEELFLELLEVLDSLEFLHNYMSENQESIPTSWQRLPKSLKSVENKLLNILQKRGVKSIDFQDTQPDFRLCKVVDREIRNDLPNQTITKVILRGFNVGDKLLRSIEVITSKTEK